MAFPEVNEEVVYLTAGAAVPAVIDAMLVSLLNDDFATAYRSILKVGYSPIFRKSCVIFIFISISTVPLMCSPRHPSATQCATW